MPGAKILINFLKYLAFLLQLTEMGESLANTTESIDLWPNLVGMYILCVILIKLQNSPTLFSKSCVLVKYQAYVTVLIKIIENSETYIRDILSEK